MPKLGVFLPEMLWDMGVGRIMGFGTNFGCAGLGNAKFLWVLTGYGISRLWDLTSSTVDTSDRYMRNRKKNPFKNSSGG